MTKILPFNNTTTPANVSTTSPIDEAQVRLDEANDELDEQLSAYFDSLHMTREEMQGRTMSLNKEQLAGYLDRAEEALVSLGKVDAEGKADVNAIADELKTVLNEASAALRQWADSVNL